MIVLELTQAEAAVIERLFNQVSGIDNMRAIIPIHDKMIAAARAAEFGRQDPGGVRTAPAGASGAVESQ